MNSLIKKYKYLIVSSVLHFSILSLCTFNFFNHYEASSSSFDTKGSKQTESVKVSILHQKGFIKKESKSNKEKGESTDETYVKSVIKDQSLLNIKSPKYPKLALIKKQQGEVIVRMLVDTSGDIKKILIHKSSNYPMLDNAVVDVAKYWNVKRTLKEKTWIQVSVNFVIQ